MAPPSTITCFLCGGTHIFPGPRFEAHLQNEHGAIFDIEFLISVSQFKQINNSLPDISTNSGACVTPPRSVQGGDDERVPGVEVTTQTPSRLDKEEMDGVCTKCQEPIQTRELLDKTEIKHEPKDENLTGDRGKAASSIREAIKMAKQNGKVLDELDDEAMMNSEGESEDNTSQDLALDLPRHFMSVSPRGGVEDEEDSQEVWQCPICSMVYKRHSYFKQHMTIAHEVSQEDVGAMTPVAMSEEEFLRKQNMAEKEREEEGLISPRTAANFLTNGSPSPCYSVDKAKRKVVGKEWAPNSFSSRFTCMFCSEQFRKDYKLKLHLMMDHKDQPKEMMEKAKEELVKAKLDGCVHMCQICRNKYNSIANFTRHIKDVHQMSRNEYKEQYGDSEVVSRMFTCELCQKEVKHTRNIIGAHMKMVHLISWKEYQDIVLKLRSGDENISLPNPELFECVICGVSVKYKREHLNKKHQLDEDVYEALIAKKARGEDISEDLPEREVYTCAICERECMDFKRHLQVCHKLTEEQYMEEFCNGQTPQVKIVKQDVFKDDLGMMTGEMKTVATPPTPSSGSKKKKVKKEKVEEAEHLSTDLQCYFGCDEVFKKDYQLHLHLKLRHRNEEPEELEKAYEAANEEIMLTRRSASLFNCALCPKVFNDNGAFYGHIQNKHDISYREYKEKYGRCETESQPFECKVCGKVIKYDRNTVHTHLKNVHGINWEKYLDRIRAIRRGLEPEPLPVMKMVECRVCNISVKYLKEHLRNAHKITEKEYRELFSDDSDLTGEIPQMFSENGAGKPSKSSVRRHSLASSHNSDDFSESEHGMVPKTERESPPPPETVEVNLPATVDLRKERPPKEDIQNKLNKSCSVCQENFESRKLFIEHCQVVHGMKFKTKSGISIPPPANPAPTVGVKRKLGDDDDLEISAKKQFQNEITLEGTPSTAEYPGTFSPVKHNRWNQCTYQCAVCSKTSNSRSTITTHIVEDHAITFKQYRDKYPDLEIVTNWFECKICSMRLKFTKESVGGHLKVKHNVDLAMYESHYMDNSDWPGNEDGARRESVASYESLPGELVIAELDQSQEQPVVREKDPWNRCQFQCKLCDVIYSDRRNVKSHIVMSHKMSYQDYISQYGDPELPTAKWQCVICGSETRHARNNIYIHLRDCHSLTCDQYAAQYGMPGMERTEDGSFSWSGATSEAPVTEPSPKWNKCKFQCPICDKISNEKRHIRSHTMSAHGISLDVLEAENGDCEIHTEYFFCSVCHAEVKHCHRNILMHLQRSHNLSTAEYEAKFGEVESGHHHSPMVGSGDTDGLGQHFLITDGGGNLVQAQSSKARRSGPSRSGDGRLVRGTGSVPCEDCGRMFSTHSNKERHKREHCANIKLSNISRAGGGVVTEAVQQEVEEPTKEDLSCPLTGCEEQFVRSVHLKRHLTSAHNVQNPLLISEAEINQIQTKAESKPSITAEQGRVPPLKIKLNQNESTKTEETAAEEDKDIDKTEQTNNTASENDLVIAVTSSAMEEEAVADNLPSGVGET